MDFDADFNVWTRDKDDENSWSLALNTADLNEAVALGRRLGRGQTIAVVYEQGLFQHNGRRIVEQVAFWWSRNYYKAMGSSPPGRGSGYSDTYSEFVEYEFPNETQPEPEPESVDRGVPVTAAGSELVGFEPPAVYASVQCDRCNKLFPGNLAHRYSSEIQTGRVSGTSRSGRSSSTHFSGRSFSTTSSHSESSSSGRVYYKTVVETLCPECFARQDEEDRLRMRLYVIGAIFFVFVVGFFVLIGSSSKH